MSSIQPTLWDQCILYILSTIDTYPITLLAMLPLHIRKKIFMALSILDRLHFMDTEFMSGLEMVEHSGYTPDSNTMVTLSTKESSNNIKQRVLQAVFARPHHLEGFSVLDHDNFMFLFQCIHSCSNPTKGLSLLLKWIDSVKFNNMALRTHHSRVFGLIPSRHFKMFKYFCLWSKHGSAPPMATIGQRFITYCNLNTFGPAYLSHLTITKEILCSLFWYEYKSALDKAIEQAKIKGVRDLTTIDPTLAQPIYPHLQELLSHVEELHFDIIGWVYNCEDEANIIVPYLLMCNAIANRSTARLKSIRISRVGYREPSKTLYTIAGFLVGCDFFASSYCYNVEIRDDNRNHYCYSLCPPEGEPYYIENVTIGLSSWNGIDFKVFEVVLENRMSTLTSFTIDFLLYSRLSTQDYFQLLTGTLIQFVKQPQFRSLTLLGKTPEGNCYELVKAFLASATSHDQQLTIKVIEDEQAIEDFLSSDYCQSYYKSKLVEEIKQFTLKLIN